MNTRSFLALGLSLAIAMQLSGCSKGDKTPPAPSTASDAPLASGETLSGGATPEDHDAFAKAWTPKLPADQINIEVRPGVEVATAEQANSAVVLPNALHFNAANNPDVADWQPGRIVVSGASAPGGKNPLGFARKVVSVERVGDNFVVTTTTPGIEEIITGDMQVRFDREKARAVEWGELDLEWAADNLYVNMPTLSPQYGEPLRTNTPPQIYQPGTTPNGDPFFGSIVDFVVDTANDAGSAIRSGIERITPSHLNGDITLDKELEKKFNINIFDINNAKHTFKTKKDLNVEASFKGRGDFDATFLFNPHSSLRMVIPSPIHSQAPPLSIDLDVDAYFRAELGIKLDLEAKITSVGGEPANDLEEKLKEGEEVATAAMEAFGFETFGDPKKKAVGGWRKPLFISKPMTQTVLVGAPPVVVPVVFTQTFQVDVECGFEARASLKAEARLIRSNTFKLKAGFDSKTQQPYIRDVDFGSETTHTASVTGGGEVQLSCGLIPRINAFVYDAVGINVGIRASAMARASYESVCKGATSWQPKGTVELDVGIGIGLQAGGRIQVPGSSYAGTSAQDLGTDIGPFEPWNKYFEVFKREWDVFGLGYCSPPDNGLLAACKVNTDCRNGLYCTSGRCGTSHCGDGVRNGDETGIDCGGSCGACGIGSQCRTGDDCQSGACLQSLMFPTSKHRFVRGKGVVTVQIAPVKVCAADLCQGPNLLPDSSCRNLEDGVRSGDASRCASGFSNGYACVANACSNLKKDNGETDVDCGGPNCARCRDGLMCAVDSDCSSGSCIDGSCAARAVTQEKMLSLASHNAPNLFIRHKGFIGFLEAVDSDLARKDTTFKQVAGLADHSHVSFESVNFPGYFLVVEGNGIALRQRAGNNPAFNSNATFIQVAGLADASKLSLESHARRGSYILHDNGKLQVRVPEGMEGNATFSAVAPRCTGAQCKN